MNVIKTKIKDLLIIEPKVFLDDRGFFMESYNHAKFVNAIGKNIEFVQDNHSKSSKGVLRGLHYQTYPYAQGKLVRCTLGEVFDVAVDMRKDSLTYGEWVAVLLSSSNKRQFWIPEGFAHGFLVLSDEAEFMYKTTNYYNPGAENGIRWNDPIINIKWPSVDELILSETDKNLPFFNS